jgi:hypothetical protein
MSATTRRWAGSHRHTDPVLVAGEHRLMRERSSDASAEYVATERALYRCDGGERAWQRVAWMDVARVEHAHSSGELILRTWPDGHEPTVRLPVEATSRLRLLAQERVDACQVLVRRVEVGRGVGAVITALREPGTGEISWRAHLLATDGQDDPVTSVLLNRALRELRVQAGC